MPKMELDDSTKRSIIKDVVRRPLESLMPIQDLSHFVDATDYDIEVSIDDELEDHLTKEVYDDIKLRIDEPHIRDRILQEYNEFSDDDDHEINFKSLTIAAEEDIPIERLEFDKALENEIYVTSQMTNDKSSGALAETVDQLSGQPPVQSPMTKINAPSYMVPLHPNQRESPPLPSSSNLTNTMNPPPGDMSNKDQKFSPENVNNSCRGKLDTLQPYKPPAGPRGQISDYENNKTISSSASFSKPPSHELPRTIDSNFHKRPGDDNERKILKKFKNSINNLDSDLDVLRGKNLATNIESQDTIKFGDLISTEYLINVELYLLRNKYNGTLANYNMEALKSIEIGCTQWLNKLSNLLQTSMNHASNQAQLSNIKPMIEKGMLLCKICFHIMSGKNFDREITVEDVVVQIRGFIIYILKVLIERLNLLDDNVGASNDTFDIVNWTNDLLRGLLDITENCILSDINISSIIPGLIFAVSLCPEAKLKDSVRPLIINCATSLISIYRNYPVERREILAEVTYCMKAIKSKQPRLITVMNGTKIHILSYILFNVLQQSQIKDLKTFYSQLDGTGTTDLSSTGKKLSIELSSIKENIHFILETLYESYLNGERNGLDMFVEDLSSILTDITYSASNSIIEYLIPFIYNKLKTDITQPTETGLVNLSGIICTALYQLKAQIHSKYILDPMILPEDIDDLENKLTSVNDYMIINRKLHDNMEDSRLHLLLTYFNDLFSLLNKGSLTGLDALGSDESSSTISLSSNTIVCLLNNVQAKIFDSEPSCEKATQINEFTKIIDYYKELILLRIGDNINTLVYTITNALESGRAKTRSKAIRIISNIYIDYPKILNLKNVQSLLAKLINDEAPSVRDPAIDLVSKFISSRPDLIDKYISIANSLDDSSISVRKRSINIIDNMYYGASNESKAFLICKLLSRMEEEEEDSILKSMNNSLVKYLLIPNIEQSSCIELSEILIKVIKNGKIPRSSDNLESFLSHIFALNDQKHVEIIRRIVGNFFDLALSLNVDEESEKVLSLFSIITVFVKTKGDLLKTDCLRYLVPFLKNGNSNYISQTFGIVKYILPYSTIGSKTLDQYLTIFIDTLDSMVNGQRLEDAVLSIVKLCRLIGSYDGINSIIFPELSLLTQLINKNESKVKDPIEEGKILKSLLIVTFITCHFDIEKLRATFSVFGLQKQQSALDFVISLYLQVYRVSNLKPRTVTVLLVLGTYHPIILNNSNVTKVLDEILESKNDVQTMNVTIRGFCRILQKFENDSKVTSKHESQGFNQTSNKVIDDNSIAHFIQRYTDIILGLTLQYDDEFGISLIHFINLAVKVGIMPPTVCIGHIIALESFKNLKIRQKAVSLHKFIFTKQESIADTAYSEAFKLAVSYRARISPSLFEESYFLRICYSVIAQSLTSRKRFIDALTKLYSIEISSKLKIPEAFLDRDAAIYTMLNIMNIPFETVEEVLKLIFHADKILLRKALDLLESLDEDFQTSTKSEKVLMCLQCNSIVALISFRKFLVLRFNITENLISDYKPNKVNVELRAKPKVNNEVFFEFDFNDILNKDEIDLMTINRIVANSMVKMQTLKL